MFLDLASVTMKSAQGCIPPIMTSGRTRNAELVTRRHTHKKHCDGHLNLSPRLSFAADSNPQSASLDRLRTHCEDLEQKEEGRQSSLAPYVLI